ncbi:hypothetical protein BJV77DRAFT_202333 [Russula vinacea]|nr:hypothetical protein BJV77DRAFT_202333 [Russula vinacea]
MPLLAAPLALSVFFSGLVVAQILAPDCNSTWAWSYNELAQNPCMIRAFMMSTCTGGSFTTWPLQPRVAYAGPNGTIGANLKLCMCTTVAYSLISACGGCQGGTWITWSEYSANCTTTPPAPEFPNPVPEGTRVPYWALLDPTVRC